MQPTRIPVHADEPPHFLLWAADEIAPIILGFGFGIMLGQIFVLTLLGLIVAHIYKRFRDQHADGFLFHYLYWRGLGFTKSPSMINPFIRKLFP